MSAVASPARELFLEYTCSGCALGRRQIPMRDRLAGEDVLDWSRSILQAMWEDHHAHSPACSGIAKP